MDLLDDARGKWRTALLFCQPSCTRLLRDAQYHMRSNDIFWQDYGSCGIGGNVTMHWEHL
jgi:hypothetical protein